MKKLLSVLFILFGMATLVACTPDEVDPTEVVDPVNNGTIIDFGDTFTQKSKIRVWIDDENGEYMEAVIAEKT